MTMAVHSTTTTTALTSSETVLGCRIATTIQGEGLRARVGRVGGERLTLSPSLLAGDCGPSAPPTVNLLNTWPSAPQMTRSTPPKRNKNWSTPVSTSCSFKPVWASNTRVGSCPGEVKGHGLKCSGSDLSKTEKD